MSRAKNLSPLPCRLDMLTLGLAHCLRAHSVILRENNEKKLAYAELTHWEISKKWYLTTGFAYATACFHRQICLQHQRCEDEDELEVEEEEEELRAFPEGLPRTREIIHKICTNTTQGGNELSNELGLQSWDW